MANVRSKGRQLAASNSRWQVYFDHLVDDKGNKVHDFLVLTSSSPRPNQMTGIVILPVIGDKFVLVRVFRHALGRESWEAPRGFVDDSESATEAALRELTEETGLRSTPADLVALGQYAPEPATMAARATLFATRRCDGQLHECGDELGLGTVTMVDRKTVADFIARGEIEDAGTLIAFYRFCELDRQ